MSWCGGSWEEDGRLKSRFAWRAGGGSAMGEIRMHADYTNVKAVRLPAACKLQSSNGWCRKATLKLKAFSYTKTTSNFIHLFCRHNYGHPRICTHLNRQDLRFSTTTFMNKPIIVCRNYFSIPSHPKSLPCLESSCAWLCDHKKAGIVFYKTIFNIPAYNKVYAFS